MSELFRKAEVEKKPANRNPTKTPMKTTEVANFIILTVLDTQSLIDSQQNAPLIPDFSLFSIALVDEQRLHLLIGDSVFSIGVADGQRNKHNKYHSHHSSQTEQERGGGRLDGLDASQHEIRNSNAKQ
jgi:hypothetical protein